MNMRIAYISFIKEPWGGSEELWASSAELALKEGHEVIISAVKLDLPSPRFEEFSRKGAKVLYRRGFINPKWNKRVRVFRKIILFLMDRISNPYREVFREKPDVIIFASAAYSMALNRRLFDPLVKGFCPYILNVQGNSDYGRPINNEEAAYLREVFARASLNLFVSQRNLLTAERHLLQHIPHAMVVRNPVNLSNREIVTWPTGTNHYRIAIVANLLINQKGQDLAFEVFSSSKWAERPVTLHLYGAGFDDAYLKELSRFFSLGDRVVFHGRVSDIRQVWAENHLMLLPSLAEGTPLALVEAMLCGRPSVVTDVGDNADWVRDGVDGFVAGGANINAIDGALERAWSHRDVWASMGQAAHERAFSMIDPTPDRTLLNLILEHGHRP
jgi:glycosyltransferase involved in cell wall biosynthesis